MEKFTGHRRNRCEEANVTPVCKISRDLGRLSLILVAACVIAAPAHSQDKPLPTRTEKGLIIEEVIVTVSKREESLQDVLGSVSAISSETLQRENVQDFASLVELVPGMVAQDEERIAIRGISRTRDGPSPVAFHVNDVFLAERGEPYYDLEAIEILRGPSGTLFGRNATAGAINAKWRRPREEWGGGFNVRYTTRKEEQVQGYLNIPMIEEGDRRLLGRFAMQYRRGDGILDNLLEDDRSDPGNFNDWLFRVYLTSELTDNLQLALRAIRFDSSPSGAPSVRSPTLATRRSGDLERLGAQPLPDDVTEVRSRVHKNFGETYNQFNRLDGEITWSLSDLPWLGNVDLVMIGGMQSADSANTFDNDGTEATILEGIADAKDNIRRTAELRVVSQNDTGVDWLLGLFWYRQTQTNSVELIARGFQSASDLGLGPSFPGEPQFILEVDVNIDNQRQLDHSEAAFLNVDLDLAQLFGWAPVEITAGIRRNVDEFSQKTGSQVVFGRLPEFDRDLGRVQDLSDVRQFADFTETTGELGARWFYSDDGMLYVQLARGYKPGLAQLVTGLDGSSIQNPVDPEFLNALEMGWKTSFFDRKLMFNVAAFSYDYKDLQVAQLAPGGFITENAAAATINGAEFGVQWSPTPAFNLDLTAAWTDARYDDYCGNDPARGDDVEVEPGCNDENPLNFSGERMTAAPEFSAALLSGYTFSLGDFGSLRPSIKISWTDEMDRRGLGNPIDKVESRSSSDVRLAWDSPTRRWKVEAFVENIEDDNDIFFRSFAPAVTGGTPNTAALATNTPPRFYGVRIAATF